MDEDLERQYARRLGEMCRLCDIVCTWFLESSVSPENAPEEVIKAAEDIMEYVDAVRP